MGVVNKTFCCPNCSGEVTREKKSYLGFTHWFVCKDCGYRETDVEGFLDDEGELPPVHMVEQEMTVPEIKEYYCNIDTQI